VTSASASLLPLSHLKNIKQQGCLLRAFMGLNSTTYFKQEGSGWTALGPSLLGGTLCWWQRSWANRLRFSTGMSPRALPAPRAAGCDGHAPHPAPQEPSTPSPARLATPCPSQAADIRFLCQVLSVSVFSCAFLNNLSSQLFTYLPSHLGTRDLPSSAQ